jgi:hypothetical protein
MRFARTSLQLLRGLSSSGKPVAAAGGGRIAGQAPRIPQPPSSSFTKPPPPPPPPTTTKPKAKKKPPPPSEPLLKPPAPLAPLSTPANLLDFRRRMRQTRLALIANKRHINPQTRNSADLQAQRLRRQLATNKRTVQRHRVHAAHKAAIAALRTETNAMRSEQGKTIVSQFLDVNRPSHANAALSLSTKNSNVAGTTRALGLHQPDLKTVKTLRALQKQNLKAQLHETKARYLLRPLQPSKDDFAKLKAEKLAYAIDLARKKARAASHLNERRIGVLAADIWESWTKDVKQLDDIVPVNAPFLGLLPTRSADAASEFADPLDKIMFAYGPPNFVVKRQTASPGDAASSSKRTAVVVNSQHDPRISATLLQYTLMRDDQRLHDDRLERKVKLREQGPEIGSKLTALVLEKDTADDLPNSVILNKGLYYDMPAVLRNAKAKEGALVTGTVVAVEKEPSGEVVIVLDEVVETD